MPQNFVFYRVKDGDTLASIASAYGVKKPETLVTFNNAHEDKRVELSEGADPTPGSWILVPLSSGMRHSIVAGAKKIPLGGETSVSVPVSWFKVYLPDGHGGELTLEDDGGGSLQLFHPDKDSAARDAEDKELEPGSKVVWEVPKDTHGWVYALGAGTGTVKAKFFQRGIARDGTSETDVPLVPYNFWYWSLSAYANPPVAHKNDPPYQPFEKWDTKFGTESLKWEQDPVNGHCYIDPNDPKKAEKRADYVKRTGKSPRMDDPDGGLSWTGHCHNSAPASILFKQPVPNDPFNIEELEHLAAEMYGNYGQTSTVWLLRSWTRSVKEHTTKPSDDPQLFGELAATWHKALVQWVREKKHALMIDMRENRGADHSQVWNQALYSYDAELVEHPDAEGSEEEKAKDTLVKCTIYANEDFFRRHTGSEGAPADLDGNDIKHNGTGRIEELEYRLVWSGGEVQTSNAKNAWTSVKMKGESAELFAPRWLLEVKKLRSSATSGSGNPSVTPDRLFSLGVEVRDRLR